MLKLSVASALLLVACSGNPDNVDVPDDDATAAASSEPAPSSAPSAAPSSTGVDASSKFPGKVCTQMGCKDSWELKLTTKDGKPLKAAIYTIDLVADGKKATCTLDTKSETKAPACTGDLAQGMTMNTSAATFQAVPAAVEVTVTRAGKKLVSKEISPTVKEVTPNGPECSPKCKQGSDALEIE